MKDQYPPVMLEADAKSLKLKNDPIVMCNVWCVSNTKTEIDLGLPEGDKWMPIAVDFSKIVAIKLAGENEFLGGDKPVVYLPNDNFTIDIPYQQAIKMWRAARK